MMRSSSLSENTSDALPKCEMSAVAIFGLNPKVLFSAHRYAFSSKSFIPANKQENRPPEDVGRPVFLFFIIDFSFSL